MIAIDNIDYIGYAASLAMLSVASYMDIKSREIDPRLWIPFIAIGIVISAVKIYFGELDAIYLAINLLAPLMIAILAFQGLIGFADFFALLAISLLITEPFSMNALIPPSIMILLISNLSIVFGSMIPLTIINLRHYRMVKKICGSGLRSFIIISTSRIMSIEKYLSKKHYFPLMYPIYTPKGNPDDTASGGSVGWECRTSFLIDEEPEEYKREFESMIKSGAIDSNTLIAVSWGIPFIAFMLISVALYPLIGEALEQGLKAFLTLMF